MESLGTRVAVRALTNVLGTDTFPREVPKVHRAQSGAATIWAGLSSSGPGQFRFYKVKISSLFSLPKLFEICCTHTYCVRCGSLTNLHFSFAALIQVPGVGLTLSMGNISACLPKIHLVDKITAAQNKMSQCP